MSQQTLTTLVLLACPIFMCGGMMWMMMRGRHKQTPTGSAPTGQVVDPAEEREVRP